MNASVGAGRGHAPALDASKWRAYARVDAIFLCALVVFEGALFAGLLVWAVIFR